jgi:RNA polymerase sigma-70 factor (ECF subfamily)
MRSSGNRGSLHWRLLPVVEAALRRVIPTRDHEYEDLLQSACEAVLAALRKNSFRGESSLSTWVTNIAKNVAIDVLRARSRERHVFAHGADTEGVAARTRSPEANPERLAEVREQLSRYHEVLRRLPPSKAQIVYLYDVVGFGLEEIARSLSLSVAATQSRLVRGRKEVDDRIASMDGRGVDFCTGRCVSPASAKLVGSTRRRHVPGITGRRLSGDAPQRFGTRGGRGRPARSIGSAPHRPDEQGGARET